MIPCFDFSETSLSVMTKHCDWALAKLLRIFSRYFASGFDWRQSLQQTYRTSFVSGSVHLTGLVLPADLSVSDFPETGQISWTAIRNRCRRSSFDSFFVSLAKENPTNATVAIHPEILTMRRIILNSFVDKKTSMVANPASFIVPSSSLRGHSTCHAFRLDAA